MTVPQNIVDFLKLREGFKPFVYNDSRGKRTAGLGHLLSISEAHLYGLNSTVPDSVLEMWTQEDTQKAYSAALGKAEALRVTDSEFIKILTSSCFQLGAAWGEEPGETPFRKELADIWQTMLNNRWRIAAGLISESLWMDRTPVRATDLQKAVLALISGSGAGDAPAQSKTPLMQE